MTPTLSSVHPDLRVRPDDDPWSDRDVDGRVPRSTERRRRGPVCMTLGVHRRGRSKRLGQGSGAHRKGCTQGTPPTHPGTERVVPRGHPPPDPGTETEGKVWNGIGRSRRLGRLSGSNGLSDQGTFRLWVEVTRRFAASVSRRKVETSSDSNFSSKRCVTACAQSRLESGAGGRRTFGRRRRPSEGGSGT